MQSFTAFFNINMRILGAIGREGGLTIKNHDILKKYITYIVKNNPKDRQSSSIFDFKNNSYESSW
jgi:hypothetical protein